MGNHLVKFLHRGRNIPLLRFEVVHCKFISSSSFLLEMQFVCITRFKYGCQKRILVIFQIGRIYSKRFTLKNDSETFYCIKIMLVFERTTSIPILYFCYNVFKLRLFYFRIHQGTISIVSKCDTVCLENVCTLH